MRVLFRSFATSEDGAVTVDWVVLTALVLSIQIGLLIAVMRDSMVDVSNGTADTIGAYQQFTK